MKSEQLQICELPGTAVIAVTGADATTFLQAQLSQDLLSVAPGYSTLAAWHDPRGRVRALFRALPVSDGWLLATDASLAAETAAALARFVLRSRAALAVLEDWRALAIIDASTDELADLGIGLGHDAEATVSAKSCHCLRIGPRLVHLLGPTVALEAFRIGHTGTPDLSASLEIRLGLPIVSAESTGKYIPQMLNLDRLGAIAFDKGCYPGQEVIARTHNLGAVKRRACAFHLDTGVAEAGDALLNDAGETEGIVIRAAAHPGGGSDLLAVVRLDALDRRLFLENAAASPLARIGLPFETTADG